MNAQYDFSRGKRGPVLKEPAARAARQSLRLRSASISTRPWNSSSFRAIQSSTDRHERTERRRGYRHGSSERAMDASEHADQQRQAVADREEADIFG